VVDKPTKKTIKLTHERETIMALKIRMARRGTTNRPFYHIVATDSRSPRDGQYLEKLGTYNPLETDATKKCVLVADRINHFISVGAQPSDRVAKLMAQAGLGKAPVLTEKPIKSAPKKRSQERATSKAEKEEALKEAAKAPQEVAAPVVEEAAPAPVAEEAAPVAEAEATTDEAAA
jgi:small subunit ribosomal protein S16